MEDAMADWRLNHFYHTIINAKDIDETVRFYEMLGFVIASDRRDAVWPDGSGASFALIPNPKGRGVLMILPSDPNGPMLDLIEWQGAEGGLSPAPPPPPPPCGGCWRFARRTCAPRMSR